MKNFIKKLLREGLLNEGDVKQNTIDDVISVLINNDKVDFIVDSEWIVTRNGNRVDIQHTYHYKGDSFDDIKLAIRFLKPKLRYMVKRGYPLNIEYR